MQNAEDYMSWLRLVAFIDSGSKKMCAEILHIREGFPQDGARLYQTLHSYENRKHYLLRHEILCPSTKIIDESKFDLILYTTVIQTIFGNKYNKPLEYVRTMRNNFFHMKDISNCTVEFEYLWNTACGAFHGMGFDMASLANLKTCNLFLVEECKGILEISIF